MKSLLERFVEAGNLLRLIDPIDNPASVVGIFLAGVEIVTEFRTREPTLDAPVIKNQRRRLMLQHPMRILVHRALDAVLVAENLLALEIVVFPGQLDIAPAVVALAIRPRRFAVGSP